MEQFVETTVSPGRRATLRQIFVLVAGVMPGFLAGLADSGVSALGERQRGGGTDRHWVDRATRDLIQTRNGGIAEVWDTSPTSQWQFSTAIRRSGSSLLWMREL